MKKSIICTVIAAIMLAFSLFSFSSCEKVEKTSYTADVVFDDERMSIDCTLDVLFVNTYDFDVDTLCFNTYGNAYRENAKMSPIPPEKTYEAYYGKKSYGYIDVKECYINGEKATYAMKGEDLNLLCVSLNEPLKSGESVKARIEFSESLSKAKHRLGYNEKTVNLGNFLPVLCVYENASAVECPYYSIGDPFYSEVADYVVKIKTPSEYTIAASGECTDALLGGRFTTYTYELENARDFAFFASKNFNVVSGKVDGVALNYYYVSDDDPSRSFEVATDALHTFKSLYCEYPYKTLAVVESPLVFGGMEYPSICLIADDLQGNEKTESIVHEIAHQWWYGLVGTNEVENGFIDESLAQYSVALFFDENAKYGTTKTDYLESLQKDLETFKEVYKITGKKPDMTVKRAIYDYSTTYEYTIVNYCYAPILLDEVQEIIGKDAFIDVLKGIVNDYAFKNIGYDEFISAFKAYSKIDGSCILDNLFKGNIT